MRKRKRKSGWVGKVRQNAGEATFGLIAWEETTITERLQWEVGGGRHGGRKLPGGSGKKRAERRKGGEIRKIFTGKV